MTYSPHSMMVGTTTALKSPRRRLIAALLLFSMQWNTGVGFRSRRCRSPLCSIARGGDITEEIQQTENNSSPSQRMVPFSSLPLIDTKSVSLALRLTCETNRRLHLGTTLSGDGALASYAKTTEEDVADTDDSLSLQPRPYTAEQQLYSQQEQYSVPPTVRSIPTDELIEERRKEELTVFHSEHLWGKQQPTGDDGVHVNKTDVAEGGESQKSRIEVGSRWGPDLQSYLDGLLSAIGLGDEESSASGGSSKQLSPMQDERQMILALALLYIDRSTFVDTPLHVDPQSGQPWFPPCPHLLPRTAHRMILTAMTISAKCVRGEKSVSGALLGAANSMLGEKNAISDVDLEQMESWMIHALSAATGIPSHPQHEMSWQITQDEIGIFLRKWGATFYPQRLAAHDQMKMKQLERFWRDQSAAFGTNNNHGHGNYWPDRSDHSGVVVQQARSMQYGSSMNYPPSHDGYEMSSHGHLPQQQQYYEEFGSEPF